MSVGGEGASGDYAGQSPLSGWPYPCLSHGLLGGDYTLEKLQGPGYWENTVPATSK